MFWKPLRDLISYYYLNAPLRLGGWEGSEHMDICASLTSLPSSHWIGDIRHLETEIQSARDNRNSCSLPPISRSYTQKRTQTALRLTIEVFLNVKLKALC